jgi:RNA polymerase sigma-70 factor (ECF subfamily)
MTAIAPMETPPSSPGDSTILGNYLPKLIRLAEQNLSPALRRKVDENDIAESVILSVILKVREGKLHIEQSEDFWKLLVAVTLNKVRKKARYWKQQKRSIAREQELAADGPRIEEIAIDPSTPLSDPTNEEGEAFAAILEKLSSNLDATCVAVLNMKIEGLSHMQIAEKLQVSTRSVTRYVTRIQHELSQLDSDSET